MDVLCLNCGNNFKGDYCPHCGQKAKTKRLRLSEMVNNFVGSFVGGDNKFLNTCRDLICHPGYMVKDYLLGKRIRYYNPLQMYVFILTLYAIISFVLGITDSVFDELTRLDFGDDEDVSKYASVEFIMNQLSELSSNKLYGTLLLTLFAVLPYRWLFRKCKVERQDGRKLALNYTEQFYAQMYHSCITLTLSTIMLPLCLIPGSDNILTSFYQVITIVYLVVLYRQLMGIKWWKSLILCILATIMTIILFAITLFIVVIPIGVVEGLKG